MPSIDGLRLTFSMATSVELDDLDALICLPGFQRFLDHVGYEWGPAGERFQRAVKQAAEKSGDDAVHALKMVLFAQTEIRTLLGWPAERLQQLRSQGRMVAEAGASRRGAGL